MTLFKSSVRIIIIAGFNNSTSRLSYASILSKEHGRLNAQDIQKSSDFWNSARATSSITENEKGITNRLARRMKNEPRNNTKSAKWIKRARKSLSIRTMAVSATFAGN